MNGAILPITDAHQSSLFVKSLTRKQAVTLAVTFYLKSDFTEQQLTERLCEAMCLARHTAIVGIWKGQPRA